MHISEGILSAPLIAAGWAVTVSTSAVILRRVRSEDIPKTAVITSAFFVASLIHVPLGPASVHLVLNGLVGVILGPAAFPSILLGLTLQAILFQHGGITVIGTNTVIIGVPALMAFGIFRLRSFFQFQSRDLFFGFLAGAVSTALSGLLLALFLAASGEAFIPAAKLTIAAHVPVMLVEGIITAATVSFLVKVKPEILGHHDSSYKQRTAKEL